MIDSTQNSVGPLSVRIVPPNPSERWITNRRFRKRSDQIAEEMKAWIVTHNMRPGDKLPQEKELTRHFGVSKGTAREALKALEVQGLVHIVTGPGGGAVIAEVSEDRAMDLIGYYFYFRTPTVRQIYDVRKILEPELAVSAIGHLTEEHFTRLHALITDTAAASSSASRRRELRKRELEFHDVLAEACPNTWLSFACRFMNRLLGDYIVFRKLYLAPQREFARSNACAHETLLSALRRGREGEVRRVMARHMEEAANHMIALEGSVDRSFLLRSS